MPRTADRVANDEAVGERAVVVGAMRADGEGLVAPPHQNHVIVARAAGNRHSVLEILKSNARREIRLGVPVRVSHGGQLLPAPQPSRLSCGSRWKG
jgi:hypothetical protein